MTGQLDKALSVARDHLEIASEMDGLTPGDAERVRAFARRATRALGDRCPNGCGPNQGCSECPTPVEGPTARDLARMEHTELLDGELYEALPVLRDLYRQDPRTFLALLNGDERRVG